MFTTKTFSTKTIAITLAAFTGLAAMATTQQAAEASDAAVAAGIGGFVAGAIVGSAVSSPRYYAPAPAYVYERPVVVHRAPAGVTPAGVSYAHAQRCAARYRSYDWNSNTFVTYGGQVRWCR